MNWEIGIDIYTLIRVKYITNKNLLYKKIKFKKNEGLFSSSSCNESFSNKFYKEQVLFESYTGTPMNV